MDYFCSVHGLQFSLSSMWVLVNFFFPEKDHRLATLPSLFSVYSTGTSLSAQIMTPVWHAESSSVMSGSFQVRDRDRETLEIQVNCCRWMTVASWKSDPGGGWNPESCCLSVFLSHLRGPITCADRLGLRLWCIWAQSQPTATESS